MGLGSIWGKKLKDIKISRTYNINGRTVAAPIVAATMATLLFVYARSSIVSAKRNAQRHRIEDGGQISWYNENKRSHGVAKRPEEPLSVKGLISQKSDEQPLPSLGSPQISKNEEVVLAQRRRKA